MRSPENNEIDLLLRRLAQTQSEQAGAVGREDRESEGHLDADELSSFAEGTLPAATRSFYAGHLADCSRCRSIVARLATAAGAGSPPVATAPETSSWRSFVATLFTPSVWRYGLPALAVVLLAAIAFIALRQSASETFVARNSDAELASQPAAPTAGVGEPKESTRPYSSGDTPSREKSLEGFIAEKHGQAKNEREAPKETEKATSREAGTDLADSVAASPVPSSAADTTAGRPPKPADEVAAEAKKEEVAKAKQQPAAPRAEQRVDDRKNRQEKDETSRQRTGQPATVFRPSGAVAGRTAGTQTGSADAEDTPTRLVGGRRFKRVNNAWVDTAYESAIETINVVRDSEQYRALVGDEPTLRTIAEQLAGEVIVVWRGRAYRIR